MSETTATRPDLYAHPDVYYAERELENRLRLAPLDPDLSPLQRADRELVHAQIRRTLDALATDPTLMLRAATRGKARAVEHLARLLLETGNGIDNVTYYRDNPSHSALSPDECRRCLVELQAEHQDYRNRLTLAADEVTAAAVADWDSPERLRELARERLAFSAERSCFSATARSVAADALAIDPDLPEARSLIEQADRI